MLRPTTAISQMGKLSLLHEPNVTQGWEGQGFSNIWAFLFASIPASLSQLLYKVLGPCPHLALDQHLSLCAFIPLFLQHLSFKDLGWRREFSETWVSNGLAVRGQGLRAAGGPPDYSPNAHLPPAKEKL